jgi:hypothetical protein
MSARLVIQTSAGTVEQDVDAFASAEHEDGWTKIQLTPNVSLEGPDLDVVRQLIVLAEKANVVCKYRPGPVAHIPPF